MQLPVLVLILALVILHGHSCENESCKITAVTNPPRYVVVPYVPPELATTSKPYYGEKLSCSGQESCASRSEKRDYPNPPVKSESDYNSEQTHSAQQSYDEVPDVSNDYHQEEPYSEEIYAEESHPVDYYGETPEPFYAEQLVKNSYDPDYEQSNLETVYQKYDKVPEEPYPEQLFAEGSPPEEYDEILEPYYKKQDCGESNNEHLRPERAYLNPPEHSYSEQPIYDDAVYAPTGDYDDEPLAPNACDKAATNNSCQSLAPRRPAYPSSWLLKPHRYVATEYKM